MTSKMVVNSFDSGDVLVKNNSTTLFHTSYKDNGFGQFFYDNYVSTTKMVETKTTIKENDTMKMPTMNFDFGPFTEPGVVTLSPYGIAVRSSKGEYLSYNAATVASTLSDIILEYCTNEDASKAYEYLMSQLCN